MQGWHTFLFECASTIIIDFFNQKNNICVQTQSWGDGVAAWQTQSIWNRSYQPIVYQPPEGSEALTVHVESTKGKVVMIRAPPAFMAKVAKRSRLDEFWFLYSMLIFVVLEMC